jgi:Asp-tRNA(Asn)/Glu-tRNA(Gln) amidotransferase A subunit family amidase
MMENYIQYVEDTIKSLESTGTLVRNNEISPQDLNRALGEYMRSSLMLNAEYQRAKAHYIDLETRYQEWYDQKFEEARNEVQYEYHNNKGVKPAVKEYDTRVRTKNREEYRNWQNAMKEAEARMRFVLRLLDTFERYDRVLTTLSQNMRSELHKLSLQDRMNATEKGVSDNKVRRFPVEDHDNTG